MTTLHGGTPDKPDRMPEDDPRAGHARGDVTAEQQAPWLLPCGCVKATVTSPLDHRPRCATRNPDPSTLDLSAAANALLIIDDDPDLGASHKVAARMVWEALTGLRGDAATAYAHRVLDRSTLDHRVLAVIPPF